MEENEEPIPIEKLAQMYIRLEEVKRERLQAEYEREYGITEEEFDALPESVLEALEYLHREVEDRHANASDVEEWLSKCPLRV